MFLAILTSRNDRVIQNVLRACLYFFQKKSVHKAFSCRGTLARKQVMLENVVLGWVILKNARTGKFRKRQKQPDPHERWKKQEVAGSDFFNI